MPGKEEIAGANPIDISVDVSSIVKEECDRLQDALGNGKFEEVIARYPIRETPALTEIARKMGFQNREQYEGAVMQLLVDDAEALEFVKSLFGTLAEDMHVA
jgi:hypothetical protein